MPAYVCSTSGSLQNQDICYPRLVPNARSENGVTFNRKVCKMKSECGPEGVPKADKRQYQTVILDFGRALVTVLSPPRGLGS